MIWICYNKFVELYYCYMFKRKS